MKLASSIPNSTHPLSLHPLRRSFTPLHYPRIRPRAAMSSSSLSEREAASPALPQLPINRVVLGCGAVVVDYLATVAAFPEPDDKIRSTSLKVEGGGNVGNALTGAARLGLKPRVISKVANDAQGRTILTELEADGVDTSYVVVAEEGNSPFTYIIVDNETKSRTCIHTPGYPAMVPEELSQSSLYSAIDGASIVYFDVRLHETALVVAEEATRRKIPILIDAEKKREGLDDLLNLATYIVCSEKFPQVVAAWGDGGQGHQLQVLRPQSNQNAGSLKEELKVIIPLLEETRKRKSDRLNQYLEIVEQIVKITVEIRPTDRTSYFAMDESDLSERRLEESHKQLQSLQKEKSDRLKQVLDHLNTLNSLCMVLGIDFKQTVGEVHPTLDNNEGSKNISNDTIERLTSIIQTLREVKLQRMQKLQDLATTMLELWNLMDTPVVEQQQFQSVTCNIAASEHEITEQDTLSIDFINYVGEEVSRLEQLKASKMKDIVLRKKTELEELRRRTHLVTKTDDIGFALDAIEAGAVDGSLVLEQIEVQISSAKEEAFSRKEILERVEKWLVACEEESWLEEYNRDENRYSAGRGAHLTLKRAEKARAKVNKIPGIVEALAAKVIAWESERGAEFTYDDVRLLSMLEDYMIAREEKEEERRRQRDRKRLQGQLIAEQEVHFGSKPSPSPRPQSAKKVPRTSTGGVTRRLSLGGGAIMQPPKTDSLTFAKSMRPTKKGDEWPDISPGRRIPNIGGLAAKKLPLSAINAREMDMPRKPFTHLAGVNSIPATPTRLIHIDSEASKTPMVTSIPCPKTPSTVCAMQMATTPAAACTVQVAAAKTPEMEHSFEERRLNFYLKA